MRRIASFLLSALTRHVDGDFQRRLGGELGGRVCSIHSLPSWMVNSRS